MGTVQSTDDVDAQVLHFSCCAAKLAEPGRGTPEDPELNINFYISLFNSSRYKFLALQMDHNNVLTIS